MFWKKKTSDKDLVVNDLIKYDNDNQRESFRLDTNEALPVFARFGGQKVRMLNISAGGVAFESDHGRKGDVQEFQLVLPGKKGFSLTAQAEIITITQSRICHCRLSGLDEDTVENIHQYVLYAQISGQRKKRSEKNPPHCNYKES